MSPILFHVGAAAVHAYGLALALAFLLGAWLGGRRARGRDLDPLHVYSIAALSLPAALVGARFGFLALARPADLAHPSIWFRLEQGGLVFYGGFAAAVAASACYCVASHVPFARIADSIAPSLALGHGLVRIGCFLNGCCYGRPAVWGIALPALGDGIPRQPVQIYEAAAGFALFALLLALDRPAPAKGQPRIDPGLRGTRPEGGLILVYIGAYGAIRFALEFVRGDDPGPSPLGLTHSQVTALVAIALAVGAAGLQRLGRQPTRPAADGS